MRLEEQFTGIVRLAVRWHGEAPCDLLMVLVESGVDWGALKELAGELRLVVVASDEEVLAGAGEHDLPTVSLDAVEVPVTEKIEEAILSCVARELVQPGATVLAVYSAFESGKVDSLSLIRLEEHLGRLTARDLQKLGTSVPLDTLKAVVDLAVDIGREGREGKPVGTMFVVGDTRKVLQFIHPAGFDPVKGYSRKERNLRDSRVREAVKEIAPLDGAFIVSSDGTVEKACQLIDAAHASLTLSKGLGSRHWAAAAISRVTDAIAVVVSQSNGTVRLFQNGEVILRIEPFRRAMKWHEPTGGE